MHNALARVAQLAVKPDLLLIGDSITESYLNTTYGKACVRCAGVPAALRAATAGHWRKPLVLAISGDQTQHVLWGLEHGLMQPFLRACGLINLNIGTNNLGFGHSPAEAAMGVDRVTRWLLEHTQSRVLVNLLLPRGDKPRLRSWFPPDPFTFFNHSITAANSLVTTYADSLARSHPGRVAIASCGHVFLKDGFLAKRLMPDLVHPGALGHKLLLRCLVPKLLALQRVR
jgi:lysophospholipase L1-like esterase